MPRFIAATLLLIGIALPASAQSRDRGPERVPPGHRPPPGMCRIWIDGVPPGQQPEPTDCATAVRERPAGSRVIFGDRGDDRDDDRYDDRRGKKKGKKDKDKRDRDDDDRRRDAECGILGRGECDVVDSRRPGSWPEMLAAVLQSRGRRTDDVQRWLGDRSYSVRYNDRDRDGRPERATWYDRAGQLLQEWVDADRDGIADTVRSYRDGRLVRVYEK